MRAPRTRLRATRWPGAACRSRAPSPSSPRRPDSAPASCPPRRSPSAVSASLRRRRVDGGDLDDVRVHRDAQRTQERLAEGAAGHARRRLARGGPLEDVANVGLLVLLRADQIGVPGSRQVHLRDVARHRPRVHPLLPIGVVAVGDLQGDRPAERPTMAHATRDLRRIALDLHPPAPAVTELAASHVLIEILGRRLRPAGSPSTMHVRPGPCDSPAVIRRRLIRLAYLACPAVLRAAGERTPTRRTRRRLVMLKS